MFLILIVTPIQNIGQIKSLTVAENEESKRGRIACMTGHVATASHSSSHPSLSFQLNLFEKTRPNFTELKVTI